MNRRFVILLLFINLGYHLNNCDIGNLAVQKTKSLVLNKEQRLQCDELIPEVGSCDKAFQTIDAYCDDKAVQIDKDCTKAFKKLTESCNESENQIKKNCEEANGYVTASCGRHFDRLNKVCRIYSSTLSRHCTKEYRIMDNQCYKKYAKITLKCKRIFLRYKDYCESGLDTNLWDKKYISGEFKINENLIKLENIKKMATSENFFDDINLSHYVERLERKETLKRYSKKKISVSKQNNDLLDHNKKAVKGFIINSPNYQFDDFIMQTFPKYAAKIVLENTKLFNPDSKENSIMQRLENILKRGVTNTVVTKTTVKPATKKHRKRWVIDTVLNEDNEEIFKRAVTVKTVTKSQTKNVTKLKSKPTKNKVTNQKSKTTKPKVIKKTTQSSKKKVTKPKSKPTKQKVTKTTTKQKVTKTTTKPKNKVGKRSVIDTVLNEDEEKKYRKEIAVKTVDKQATKKNSKRFVFDNFQNEYNEKIFKRVINSKSHN